MKRVAPAAVILLFILVIATFASAAPIRLSTGTLEPGDKASAKLDAVAAAQAAGRGAHYLVQFVGPPTAEWKRSVTSLGVSLQDYIPENAFIAKMTSGQAEKVLALEFVRWVERLRPEHRVGPRVRKGTGPQVDVIIRLSPGESPKRVQAMIKSIGGKVLAADGIANGYIRAKAPAAAVGTLSALEEVLWIEEWVQPRLTNNVAQGIAGVPTVRSEVGLFGSGQIIAFADTGLDTGNISTLSADFAGRLLEAYPIARENEWSDIAGHGTHVLGIATGSGVLSGSNPAGHSYTDSFAGIAPEAGFIIQSIGDETLFVHPPLDLSTLFGPTYEDGARIHSDSWGAPSYGEYTVYAQQIDDFAWNHKDFVLIFPAGNDGRDKVIDGVTDLNCMYAPATAKNCISVGATESVRSTGRIKTYFEAWPSDFPMNPIRNDYISDDAQGMVSWSGRGPCADGRIKPDICAPGTNIISSLTHQISSQIGWAPYDSNYIYWGGTSMSVPMVAGAAALVREYYNTVWSVQPSAALVKATLLNNAAELHPGQHGPGATQEIPSLRPNNVEGWGRLDLDSALAPAAPRVVSFVDEVSGLTVGQTVDYVYSVLNGSMPFAVTLVWTDPPGSPLAEKQLVNDLNLSVIAPDGTTTYLGNGAVDDTNNVEGVDIPTPLAGSYTVRVSAANVPTGPQPFALLVSGALPGTYISGSVELASGRPVPGVTITADGGGITRTTVTGANGSYTIHLPEGTYNVTAFKTGPWAFDPVSREVIVSTVGVTDVDFAASAPAGSMSGTVAQVLGGYINYVLDTPHPYANNSDLTYIITARPSATQIRVHFDEIGLEDDVDFVWVEDAAGNRVGPRYTGSYTDRWSDWVTGNVIKVRLASDDVYDPLTTYGFYIDGYETDQETIGPLSGVTLAIEPNGGTCVTQPDGTYLLEALEPGAYTVTPSLANWGFKPDQKTVEVPAGGEASDVDFAAAPPGSITGVVKSGSVSENVIEVESEHPYPENALISYTVQGPPGTSRLRVHFTQIETELGFDFVFVADANDNIVDTYDESPYSSVWSSWIVGDSLKIILESDDSYSEYGFYADKIEAVTNEQGIAGVTVRAEPGGRTVQTGPNGAFVMTDLPAGRYTVTPAHDQWSFAPFNTRVSVVPGMATANIDYYGTLSPNVAYVKSLQNGSPVNLFARIVTAGTDQLGGCCYIEDESRACGIKVVTTQTVREGDRINIVGVVGTVSGERQITASTVTVVSSQNTIPLPVGMAVKAVGGGPDEYTSGTVGGIGVAGTGLLITTWGKVTSFGAGYFLISDGSTHSSGEAMEVKVLCPAGVTPPETGFVTVTGISSVESSVSGFIPVLRLRKSDDLRTVESGDQPM